MTFPLPSTLTWTPPCNMNLELSPEIDRALFGTETLLQPFANVPMAWLFANTLMLPGPCVAPGDAKPHWMPVRPPEAFLNPAR